MLWSHKLHVPTHPIRRNTQTKSILTVDMLYHLVHTLSQLLWHILTPCRLSTSCGRDGDGLSGRLVLLHVREANFEVELQLSLGV